MSVGTFGKALWESLKQPFDRLLDGLTENAEEVDKAAQTQHMREAKKGEGPQEYSEDLC